MKVRQCLQRTGAYCRTEHGWRNGASLARHNLGWFSKLAPSASHPEDENPDGLRQHVIINDLFASWVANHHVPWSSARGVGVSVAAHLVLTA
jgi:hypothetical protein